MRSVFVFLLSALAMCLALASSVQASPTGLDPSGDQVFTDLGVTMANGSATGNINTATTFTFDDWVSTHDDSGVFAGMPVQSFGVVSFTSTTPTSLDFGDSVFGTFRSTSITKEPSAPGFADFLVLGVWTPGTFGGVSGGPFPAELRIALSQTGEFNGLISASGTVTFSTVPEPSSVVLVLASLVLGAALYGFRLGRRHLDRGRPATA